MADETSPHEGAIEWVPHPVVQGPLIDQRPNHPDIVALPVNYEQWAALKNGWKQAKEDELRANGVLPLPEDDSLLARSSALAGHSHPPINHDGEIRAAAMTLKQSGVSGELAAANSEGHGLAAGLERASIIHSV